MHAGINVCTLVTCINCKNNTVFLMKSEILIFKEGKIKCIFNKYRDTVLLSLVKTGSQLDIKEMATSEMTDSGGITAATAFEPELSRKMVKSSITQNQDTRSPCKEQTQESSQAGLSKEVNVEWHPSNADTWVQCEDCKKWHMLPDESDPTILPDKW